MRIVFLILLSLILLTAFKNTQRLKRPNDIICTLTSDKKIYKIGELPKLKIQISNNTKTDIYLIGSLDGSDVKWRFPYCYYTIDKPKADTIRFERCGNKNTLRLEDFQLVKAGGNFDPYENVGVYGFFQDHNITNQKSFRNTGIYKIKFHYSTNSDKLEDYTGDKIFQNNKQYSIKIASFFKQVPKLDIQSNEIEITFTK